MASKHQVVLEGHETVSGAADRASGSIRRLRESMKETTGGAQDLVKAVRGFMAFGGVTAAAIGFVKTLGDCETAFVKLHPEMKNAAGSADNFKKSMEGLKAAFGGELVAAISPVREQVTLLADEWARAVTEAANYSVTIKNLPLYVGGREIKGALEAAHVDLVMYTDQLQAWREQLYRTPEDMAEIQKRMTELAYAQYASAMRQSEAFKKANDLINSGKPDPTTPPGRGGSSTSTAWDWWKTQSFLNMGKFGEGFGQTPKMEEAGAALWGGFIKSMGYGQLPAEKAAPTSETDWFMEQRANALGAASSARNPVDVISPLMEALGVLGGYFQSVSVLMQPFQIILNSALQVLQPVVDTVLAPLIGIFAILGNTLGQILVPVVQMLTPIIEVVGQGFVWLYNNIVVPVGNGVWAMFTNIGNTIKWLVEKIVALGTTIWYIVSFQWGKLGSVDWGSALPTRVTAAEGPLSAIDLGNLAGAGNGYMDNQNGTGASSSTTVQKPADVYIYFTIEGNVVGAGGKAEVGKWLVDCIQQALDVGVRPKFLENN